MSPSPCRRAVLIAMLLIASQALLRAYAGSPSSPTLQPTCGAAEVISADYGIFGSLGHLKYESATASFLIIMAGVIIIEVVFHHLEHGVKDSAYEEILVGIQKELMVVGTVAFGFKVMLSFTLIEADWLHALEYSDVVIPITSFCFCLEGLMLAKISVKQIVVWSKAYHLKLFELLDEFYAYSKEKQVWLLKSYNIPHIPYLMPDNSIMAELEFRIIHQIFCDNYKIKRSALEFNEYASRMYERYLRSIIQISFTDWFIIGLMVVLNAWRKYLGWEFDECDVEVADDHHRMLSSSSSSVVEECEALSDLKLFVLMGFIIAIMVVLTAISSRYYVLQIMKSRGISSSADFMSFLQSAEEEHEQRKVHKKSSRINSASLKQLVSAAKDKSAHKTHPKGHWYQKSLKKAWIYVTSLCSSFTLTTKDTKSLNTKAAEFSSLEEQGSLNEANADDADQSVLSYLKEKRKSYVSANSSKIVPSGGGHGGNRNTQTERLQDDSAVQLGDHIGLVHEVDPIDGSHHAHPILKKIFLFGNPKLFFAVVKSLMTIQAFFMALVTTHYIFSAINVVHSSGWAVACVLPISISLLVYTYVVEVAIILHISVYIDYDCLDETLEETEASIQLGNIMREKILASLIILGDPEVELLTLFKSLDEDGSNSLTRQELEIFLHEINVSFSHKRWYQIFRHIDRNFDDYISFDEFFLFLFPNHDVVKAQESRRLKIVRTRVEKIQAAVASNNPDSPNSAKKRTLVTKKAKSALESEDASHNKSDSDSGNKCGSSAVMNNLAFESASSGLGSSICDLHSSDMEGGGGGGAKLCAELSLADGMVSTLPAGLDVGDKLSPFKTILPPLKPNVVSPSFKVENASRAAVNKDE